MRPIIDEATRRVKREGVLLCPRGRCHELVASSSIRAGNGAGKPGLAPLQERRPTKIVGVPFILSIIDSSTPGKRSAHADRRTLAIY